jgi:hypothetical protein
MKNNLSIQHNQMPYALPIQTSAGGMGIGTLISNLLSYTFGDFKITHYAPKIYQKIINEILYSNIIH